MDKRGLVDRVCYEIRDPAITKSQVNDVVEKVFEVIRSEVSNETEVSVRGFGVFSSMDRKATRNKNPVTGEWQEVKGRRVPKFKASSTFKREVAEGE